MGVLKPLLLVFFLSLSVLVCGQSGDEEVAGFSFINDKSKLWNGGQIPYKFRDDTHSGGRYEEEEKSLIRRVMQKMESQLGPDCINFTEVANCENCLKFDKASAVCKAIIGNTKSYATMGHEDCFNDNGRVIMHEMGHVLGLVHEQNRPDRDKYVEILWDNLASGARSAMIVRRERFGDTYQTPYDYKSVMHYPKYLGGMTDKLSIRVKEPYSHFFTSDGGQVLESYPDELSAVDIFEISAAYNCSLKPKSVEKYVDYVKNITTSEVTVKIYEKLCNPFCTTTVDHKEKRLEFFGGSLYYFHPEADDKNSWSASEEYCNKWFDGHLASIHSQEEFNFIKRRLEEAINWRLEVRNGANIGGQRVDGDWKWTDKTDMDWAGLNNNWAPGEPYNKNGVEDKLEMARNSYKNTYEHKQFRLNDHPDSLINYARSFVCKVPTVYN